ncbi:TlpA family protein disulfide reductase [Chloroflexota bacterium]
MYRRKMKIGRWALPVVLAALLVLGFLPGCNQSSGAPAPDFSFPTTRGDTVTLSELRGQPVLVNFWSLTCGDCIVEMPHIQAAFEEKGEEVKFVAVHLGGGTEQIRQFAEQFGLDFIMAVDSGGQSWNRYNIRGFPVTVFVDEQGTVKHRKQGPFRNAEEIISLLDSLFGPSA